MVVIDGGAGLAAAIAEPWPETKIQCCFFHIFQNVRRHLTLAPRLEAGRKLLSLTKALMKVQDLDQAAKWMGLYASWEAHWDAFLKHRTYAGSHRPRPHGVREEQSWWYTHRALRKARSLYRALIRQESLFAWLSPDLPAREQGWPRTTSSLEGGPNRAVKELLRVHRGMSVDHSRRAVEWLLDSLTATPRSPWDLAQAEHCNPPPSRPLTTPEQDPGPAFGTHFSWEDGNGLQTGWAGR